jgi:hypothetical protein
VNNPSCFSNKYAPASQGEQPELPAPDGQNRIQDQLCRKLQSSQTDKFRGRRINALLDTCLEFRIRSTVAQQIVPNIADLEVLNEEGTE